MNCETITFTPLTCRCFIVVLSFSNSVHVLTAGRVSEPHSRHLQIMKAQTVRSTPVWAKHPSCSILCRNLYVTNLNLSTPGDDNIHIFVRNKYIDLKSTDMFTSCLAIKTSDTTAQSLINTPMSQSSVKSKNTEGVGADLERKRVYLYQTS